jgi:hypothetical protein
MLVTDLNVVGQISTLEDDHEIFANFTSRFAFGVCAG